MIISKVYRKTLQRIIRKAQLNYYKLECLKFKSNTKKLWKIINKIARKSNDKDNVIEKIKVGTIDYYKGENISGEFAKFFSNIDKNLAGKIPRSQNPKSVFLSPCSKRELKRLLNNLPNKTSSGFDGLSNVLIKAMLGSIIDPLTIIFNTSNETGEFPSMMKQQKLYHHLNPAFVVKLTTIDQSLCC